MDGKPRNLGRSYLVGKLRERGMSRRLAVRIVNLIFAEMVKALKRGRAVEFPFGRLKRVQRHFSKWWDAVGDTPANRNPYTFVHELDEAGDQELNGWQRPKKGRGRRPGKR